MNLRRYEGNALATRRFEGLDHAMLQVQSIGQQAKRGGKCKRSADERENAPIAAEIVYRIGKIYEAALEPCLRHVARGCHPVGSKTSALPAWGAGDRDPLRFSLFS